MEHEKHEHHEKFEEHHPLHGHKLTMHEHGHSEASKIDYHESKAHTERAEHPHKITHL